MSEVHKHMLYIKVPTDDRNKGDSIHPEYRSRIVAKDFRLDKRLDLFAATPPLEALKMLLATAMTGGISWERIGLRRWRSSS